MEMAFDRHVTPLDATTPTGRSPPGYRAVETVKRSSRDIHLDHHQLPSEFLAPAKETNPLRWSFRGAHLRCELR